MGIDDRLQAVSELNGISRADLRRRLLPRIYQLARPDDDTVRVLAAVGNEETAKTLETKRLPEIDLGRRTMALIIAAKVIRGTREAYWIVDDPYVSIYERVKAASKLSEDDRERLRDEFTVQLSEPWGQKDLRRYTDFGRDWRRGDG